MFSQSNNFDCYIIFKISVTDDFRHSGCISDKRNLFLKSKKYSWNACLSHLIVMYFKPQKIPFSWRILRTCLDCVLHKILDDNSKYWDQNKHGRLNSWACYLNSLFKWYCRLIYIWIESVYSTSRQYIFAIKVVLIFFQM